MFATILALGLFVSVPVTWFVLNKAEERLGWENTYSLSQVTGILFATFVLASTLT